jgi:DNA-binding transcriptional LysR family regulator
VLELKLLRAFVALADERHMGRAAAAVHMQTSPFGRQIRRLESLVGGPLVDRRVRGNVQLTALGLVVADGARTVLAGAEVLLNDARRQAAGEEGVLRVGFVNEVTADLLPLVLQAYSAARPAVRIELVEDRTRPHLDALQSGDLDVAFVRSPGPRAGLRYEPLAEEALVLASPADPGTTRSDAAKPEGMAQHEDERRPLRDFSFEPFLLLGADGAGGLRQDILDACRMAEFTPRVVREISPLTAQLLHVAAGDGVALVPASIAHQYPVPGVRYTHLSDPVPISSVGVAWLGGPADALVQGFLDKTRGVADEMRGRPDVWPERHVLGLRDRDGPCGPTTDQQ